MSLQTTKGGKVHLPRCPTLKPEVEHWPWNPRNDGPGVATACKVCLPSGLPEGDA